jgi:hypothetical protein
MDKEEDLPNRSMLACIPFSSPSPSLLRGVGCKMWDLIYRNQSPKNNPNNYKRHDSPGMVFKEGQEVTAWKPLSFLHFHLSALVRMYYRAMGKSGRMTGGIGAGEKMRGI